MSEHDDHPIEELGEDEKTDNFSLSFTHDDGGPWPTLADELEGYTRRLSRHYGSGAIGLKQETIPELDRATAGLRGLTLLAAPPGFGKTALALQLAVDVLRADPAAVLIYRATDVWRTELYHRILSRLSRLDYRTLRLGSQEGTRREQAFGDAELSRLEAAERQLQELAPRIRIIDAPSMEADFDRINASYRAAEAEGERKLLLVIDSFDAWARTSSPEESLLALRPLIGDRGAILATVETRRTLSKAKAGEDEPLVSFLGSARRAAMADLVLSLEPENSTPALGPQASGTGIGDDSARVMYLGVVKGRDGFIPGTIALTHHHRESRFEPR